MYYNPPILKYGKFSCIIYGFSLNERKNVSIIETLIRDPMKAWQRDAKLHVGLCWMDARLATI